MSLIAMHHTIRSSLSVSHIFDLNVCKCRQFNDQTQKFYITALHIQNYKFSFEQIKTKTSRELSSVRWSEPIGE